MKSMSLLVLALGMCANAAQAQSNGRPVKVFGTMKPELDSKRALAVIEVDDLFEPGLSDTASQLFSSGNRQLGLTTAAEPRRVNFGNTERGIRNHRAWGISFGVRGGPVTFRLAHQNRNVAKIAPAMPLGMRTDAKNSILAANIDIGIVKAYTAYSANRGWGVSPLWNPDNPYGAAMTSTPSTDSRDVMLGLAVPMGATTWLASVVRKDDRDFANRDAQQIAFGATYALSRKLDFYAAISHTAMRDAMVGTTLVSGGRGSSAVNVGMRHSF